MWSVYLPTPDQTLDSRVITREGALSRPSGSVAGIPSRQRWGELQCQAMCRLNNGQWMIVVCRGRKQQSQGLAAEDATHRLA